MKILPVQVYKDLKVRCEEYPVSTGCGWARKYTVLRKKFDTLKAAKEFIDNLKD